MRQILPSLRQNTLATENNTRVNNENTAATCDNTFYQAKSLQQSKKYDTVMANIAKLLQKHPQQPTLPIRTPSRRQKAVERRAAAAPYPTPQRQDPIEEPSNDCPLCLNALDKHNLAQYYPNWNVLGVLEIEVDEINFRCSSQGYDPQHDAASAILSKIRGKHLNVPQSQFPKVSEAFRYQLVFRGLQKTQNGPGYRILLGVRTSGRR
ncbi:hypothetical protein HK097_000927 [Rhizophlyctis rosea]|uniref:Uncharacterized protein n=1 Tax=Rhizophlyctis rosea TaxID=64517 RepID=A0AAD5X6Y4_9FUNG|nr:hypothetical protein HK097_000927 [Rhizophlyctis rosea]